uniref:Ketoreductase CTB6 ) n=1 Tax=Ganoderma boninense TaxID=34458 RepID=A0A5K1K2M6_9APHY|nr:Ketoreductase CTB6 (EC (Cercosporin toxin biosynthesis cluster protein 6) [Ganoderma boninense]
MESYSGDLLHAALGSLVVLFAWLVIRRGSDTRVYPPGPPRRLLIGNLRDIPSGGYEWVAYREISKRCGSDIIYLTALGSKLLVLSSFEAARDLLDRKGAIYSSRPRLVVKNELRGWNWSLILMAYGKDFLAYRRAIQQEFAHSVVVASYRPIVLRESISFIRRLFQTPQDMSKHVKQMAGAMIMMVTYGHQVTSAEDEFVALAEAVRNNDKEAPGSSIVDLIPILKYVPVWFPGAGFKRSASHARNLAWDMRYVPFRALKAELASGTCPDSMVSRLLQSDSPLEGVDRDEFAMNSGGVVYSDVQRRAQKELDDVVGRDRLPSFEDRDRLPYIANIVKETFRWKTVTPLGVPHATTEDDMYLGMFIPKGTTVIANIFAMLHDENVYNNPTEFIPERYESSPDGSTGDPDPARVAFGFGRRICPGRFFADESVWLTIALMLHTFNISNPTGVKSKVEWSSGLVSMPSGFPFKLSPRFPGVEDLVTGFEQ